MLVFFDGERRETALPDVAAGVIMLVVTANMGIEHPVHPAAQIPVFFRPDHQMKVIGQQAKCEDRHGDLDTRMADGLKEGLVVAVLADQTGRAGYVDHWPRDSENQPHHAGAAIIWGPDGEPIASTQEERIQEEMIVATLDATLLTRERSLANYMLRTRRPELFAELVRDQVSC